MLSAGGPTIWATKSATRSSRFSSSPGGAANSGRCIAGERRHPVMIGTLGDGRAIRIPIEPFELLISAFEQDQTVTEYQTFEQLLDYCKRSANPVGHLILHVAGVFTPENARMADSTCTGTSTSQFLARCGSRPCDRRIYLPREDRIRFGCLESELRSGIFTPAFARLMEFQVDRARELFLAGRGASRSNATRAGHRRRLLLARRIGHS